MVDDRALLDPDDKKRNDDIQSSPHFHPHKVRALDLPYSAINEKPAIQKIYNLSDSIKRGVNI